MLAPSRFLRRVRAGCSIGVMIALLTATIMGCTPATSPLTGPAMSIGPLPSGETGARIVLERSPDQQPAPR